MEKGFETKIIKYCAFTLAETLITLVIVGVVAALTVPNLIIKYQKEQTVTRLKKAYSTLSQALNKSVADNGPMKSWDINFTNNYNDNVAFLNKYLLPYLNILDKPKQANSLKLNKYYTLNGVQKAYTATDARFYLNDGVSITSGLVVKTGENSLYFYIDINGDKKPNKWGRDIFVFELFPWEKNVLYKDKLYAPYASYPLNQSQGRASLMDNVFEKCNRKQDGKACSALIMYDNWQIKDDYPW